MENKFGLSPLDMMTMLGPMFVVLPLLMWFLVIGPLILYPVARWRANRDAVVDPQLGMKVAMHYFKLLAFQTLLIGGVTLLFTIISKSSDKGPAYRAAFGFLVPGGLVFGAHVALLKLTNDEFVAGVRRLYLGYNMVVTGLLGFTALVFACQALFARGSAGDPGRMLIAAVLVYCGAWALLSAQFTRDVLSGGASGQPNVFPAAAPLPAAPGAGATATPGLPPLSSGSFPPIASPGSTDPR